MAVRLTACILTDADRIRPGFSATVPIMPVLNNCPGVPHSSFWDTKRPGFLPDKKKYIFDNAYENVDFPSVVESMYSSRAANDRKERERKREICRLVIVECALRLR